MLCAIAKLDDSAAGRITALHDAVVAGSETGPTLYGHITIASYTGNDEAGFIHSCREMLKGITAFTVEFSRIEFSSALEQGYEIIGSVELSISKIAQAV